MLEVNKNGRHALAEMFHGHLGGHSATAILEGQTGRVLADSKTDPRFAVLEMPQFKVSILGGDPAHPSVTRYIEALPKYAKLILSSEGFIPVLQNVHPGKWVQLERYAFSTENLNADSLQQFKTQLPTGFQVKKIDIALANQLVSDKKNEFANHHGMNFPSLEEFVSRGFGYCVLHGDEIACVASTFVICEGGMEIQIDTKKKYRGKGLATVAAAYLIAHSLENSMDPGWDAATQTSAKFAEKLGFTPQGTYFMHVFTDSKFLVHLRKVVQKFKKMSGVTAVLGKSRR